MIVKGRKVGWVEVLAIAGILALVLGSVATCQYRKKGVSEESQGAIDSLRITQPTYDSSRAATITKADANIAAAAELGLAASRLAAAAARERRNADSLATMALTAVTDAVKWRDAYYARTRERDSLQLALAAANARADAERSARLQADLRAGLDSGRLVAVQKLALRLEDDANKAANCRLLAIIPCATRTQVAVVSATAAAIVTYAIVARPRR